MNKLNILHKLNKKLFALDIRRYGLVFKSRPTKIYTYKNSIIDKHNKTTFLLSRWGKVEADNLALK